MQTLILSLRLAWSALMQNKVRSILTLLGMIIGVGAVIAIVSLGEGLRSDFERQMSSLGSDVFYMMPKAPKRPGQAPKYPDAFKMSDMTAIKEQCALVKDVVPSINIGVNAKHRDRTRQCNVLGVYEDYLTSLQTDKLDHGRFFTKAECMSAARVVVIGSEIATKLYIDNDEPVGSTIKLDGKSYLVIGKLQKRAGVFAGGPDVNEGFLAPMATVQKRMLGSDDVWWVSIYLNKGTPLNPAKEDVARIMRQRRHVRNAADDNFEFLSPDDFLKMGNQFINVLIGVFGAIAFISLLVGGVGIMNIMLVSVTERTREIGLRMAIGANRKAVLNQFLVEAVLLTLIGGIIGMLVGYLGAVGISFVLEKSLHTRWEPHIPPSWVGYAVGISVLIGVIFGVYPAFKASQLDPVEAMRYE
jgi:putative ABC transport system permease protein